MAEEAKPKSEKTGVWRFLAGIVIPILLLLGRYEIVGSGRIPKTGAFILAPNHVTNFDPLVSAYVLWRAGRVPRFLAKRSLFKVPVLGWALRVTGQIPVERSGVQRDGNDPIKTASALIDGGLAVIIYPEGTLTRDPDEWPMRGKFGAVRLALETGVEIIPTAIWGAQEVLPRYSKRLSLFPRKTVRVLIGEPLSLAKWKDAPRTPATFAAATNEVMQAITALVATVRDETPPEVRWDPAQHGQTEYGKLD
jgi:1-acyl-sn-glycerol-3-phosphate acyltransferase